LGIADLDYAEKRLRPVLAQAKYGQDWGARAVDLEACVEDLWRSSGWTVEWTRERAWRWIVPATDAGIAFEKRYAYGIWIAPAVIEALAPAAPKGKSPGAPPRVNIALIEKTARNYIKKHGCPDSLTGEGSLIEKVGLELPEKAMPSKTRAWEILKPIFDSAQKKFAK
jgi:hypothetical protein